jgi:hypothetical protein
MRSVTWALDDLLGRHLDGAVHVSEELMHTKNWSRLGLPKEEVVLRQPNRDRFPKRRNGDDSRRELVAPVDGEVRAEIVDMVVGGWKKKWDWMRTVTRVAPVSFIINVYIQVVVGSTPYMHSGTFVTLILILST